MFCTTGLVSSKVAQMYEEEIHFRKLSLSLKRFWHSWPLWLCLAWPMTQWSQNQ